MGTLLILCTGHWCNEEAEKEVEMRTEKLKYENSINCNTIAMTF